MDIVVTGRRTEVPERFRRHAVGKLTKLNKLDTKVISMDVEVTKERNPRQSDQCDRVEITCRSRGPVIRAEASASDPYAALDVASAKLEARLRRAADRRRVHHGRRTPVSVATATARLTTGVDNHAPELEAEPMSPAPSTKPLRSRRHHQVEAAAPDDLITAEADYAQYADYDAYPAEELAGDEESVLRESGPLVVREKIHQASPMSLDDALYEMELVGHDFFLFVDKENSLPSVVYRRRGYDYGVIRLEQ